MRPHWYTPAPMRKPIVPSDAPLKDPTRRKLLQVGAAGVTARCVEAGRGNEPPGVGGEEWVGLERSCALQSLGSGVCRDVEEESRNPGVGEVAGDLGSHHAGAEYRDRTNHRSKSTRSPGPELWA